MPPELPLYVCAEPLLPTQSLTLVPTLAVALKAYHEAALGRRRLELEEHILKTVRHPHIIKGALLRAADVAWFWVQKALRCVACQGPLCC